MGSMITKTINNLIGKREMRFLMVGLDAADRTAHNYRAPKLGFGIEIVEFKNFVFTVWDVSGAENIRPLWRHYYQATQGVIFVVDCNDRDRIGEVREELARMLNEDELNHVPLLVLANKQDIPDSMTAAEVTDKLNLISIRDRELFVQPCCAYTGDGLYEGMDWLSQTLAK